MKRITYTALTFLLVATCGYASARFTPFVPMQVVAPGTNSLSLVVPVTATAPGQIATVQLNLKTPTGVTSPAAIQFVVNVSSPPISNLTVTAGAASTAAGKQVACNAFALGSVTCIVFGLNANVIASGTIAQLAASVAAGTTLPSSILNLPTASAADANGKGLAVTTSNATLLLQSPCDLNADGQVNLQDVLAVVNKALANQTCGAQTCTVGDVMVEILVELGQLSCPSTGP